MRNVIKIGLLAALLGLLVGLPNVANAQAGAAATVAKSAWKSPAAIKLYDILAGYFIGKALDGIYTSATQPNRPNPEKLDQALREIQAKHPEYKMMLGTLRHSVKTDGTPTSPADFERLALTLVDQMEYAALNSTKTINPSAQWNPSAATLALRGEGLGLQHGLNRLGTPGLDGVSRDLLRDPLANPIPLGGGFVPRTVLPALTPTRESVLGAKIVGAWLFPHTTLLNAVRADAYVFHRDGKITEYKVSDRDEIITFGGKYTVEGNKLTIRWELPNGLGDILTATIEELDAGHLKYTADKAPFELAPPEAKTLTRLSDVGQFSVVTLSNPTAAGLTFRTRWATVDGFWTRWESIRFEPGAMWSIPRPGGILCQITFDASLDETVIDKTYELPHNVVSSFLDPKLTDVGGYLITVENGTVDLNRKKLDLSLPKPGVR